jgi:putative hydrolase of the HAD superfamily
VKAIIFDLGGVCLSNYFGYKEREGVAERFGFDFEKFREYFNLNKEKLDVGRLDEEEFLRSAFDFLGIDVDSLKVIEYLRNKDESNKEVLKLVSELGKNYKLYALTNEILSAARFRIKKFDLNNFFERVFVSSEIGFAKPDRMVYEHVLREIGREAEDCVYIDNREDLLVPAKELGMKVIHFKDVEQLKKDLVDLGVEVY